MLPLSDITVKLVTNIEIAAECARWLSTHDRIAVDTETTGLSPEKDIVRLVQIGDEDTAYVIPLEGVSVHDEPSTSKSQIRGWGGFAVDMLTRFDGTFDMHNAAFDHSMIKNTLGVNLSRDRIHDVRLMLHVLDSKGPLGLKPASCLHVDPHADLGQDTLNDALGKKTGWTWATVPQSFKPYIFYAGFDTILTTRLRQVVEPLVLADAPKSYELELAASWPCNDMSRKGVRLDREYTSHFHEDLVKNISAIEQWCNAQYSVYPGSDSKIIDILQRDGVDLVKRTASGARYSLDKDVLTGLTHPLAVKVLERRQAMHIAGYLRAYLGFAGDDDDDLIHTSINTVGGRHKNPFESGGSGNGVRTGRMSSSDPNLQNVPIRTKEGALIRRCFIPRTGHTWVSCDADQIESRILTHLSQDPGLIAAFNSDEDFFVNMARRLFNDPTFVKSNPRRQLVKNGVYAKIYGAGIEQLSDTSGASIAEASEFMQSFDNTFPYVPRFIKSVETLARQRYNSGGLAYVRSPMTGRRHTVDHWKIYPIVNYLIQGLAGEILKLKIVQAANAGLDKYMLFPVHDEIDFDVPNEDLPDVLETIRVTMNDDSLLSVPITWSCNTGSDWGACK
jgi:DNA polymerase-1